MADIIQAEVVKQIVIRDLGIQVYQETWQRMLEFTDNRKLATVDEIWLVQHYPVFTQGHTGKAEHLLRNSDIPIVQSDRGGQITYHGPGQQVMYVLVDVKRKKEQSSIATNEFNVRQLISILEQTVIRTLTDYGVLGYTKPDAPGVYVDQRKICSLGLKIRKGCSFHGLALNINMDLLPFQQINPCGYSGLEMCQLSDLINAQELTCETVSPYLINHFIKLMEYQNIKKL